MVNLYQYRYTQYCQAAESSTPEEVARLHEELLSDLYSVQAHIYRLEAAAAAFRREQDLYAAKQEQLHAAIAQAEQDINDRKGELEEARAELNRQKEYEALKEKVVQVPARSVTRAEMTAIERELADLSQQGSALDESMGRRKKQFASILHLIEQVHQGIYQADEGTVQEDVAVGEDAGMEEGEMTAGMDDDDAMHVD